MIDDRRRDVDSALGRDLRSYRNAADRDLPRLEDTARLLRSHAAEEERRLNEEGFWMRFSRLLHARPGLAIAGGAVMMAVVGGVIPVSYQRTTGHEVTLSFAASQVDGTSLSKIADRLGRTLHADQLRISPALDPGGKRMEIVAHVPSRHAAGVERVAGAFASALGKQGVEARVAVRPQTERVSTSLYAYARDRVINVNVSMTGKSAAEIESDIRTQLEAAGVENSRVEVDRQGDQTSVKIQADDNDSENEREFRINLTSVGADSLNAQLHRFDVECKPGMTDADVKADIERQMREAGVEGKVTVENGQVRIEIEKNQQR